MVLVDLPLRVTFGVHSVGWMVLILLAFPAVFFRMF